MAKHRAKVALVTFLENGEAYGKAAQPYIGLDHFNLKQWIGSKMDPDGMNWNNFEDRWSILHLVPYEYFLMHKEADKRLFFSYFNLYPVYKNDLSKWDLRLSLTILEEYPYCDITEQLVNILRWEIERMNTYIR